MVPKINKFYRDLLRISDPVAGRSFTVLPDAASLASGMLEPNSTLSSSYTMNGHLPYTTTNGALKRWNITPVGRKHTAVQQITAYDGERPDLIISTDIHASRGDLDTGGLIVFGLSNRSSSVSSDGYDEIGACVMVDKFKGVHIHWSRYDPLAQEYEVQEEVIKTFDEFYPEYDMTTLRHIKVTISVISEITFIQLEFGDDMIVRSFNGYPGCHTHFLNSTEAGFFARINILAGTKFSDNEYAAYANSGILNSVVTRVYPFEGENSIATLFVSDTCFEERMSESLDTLTVMFRHYNGSVERYIAENADQTYMVLYVHPKDTKVSTSYGADTAMPDLVRNVIEFAKASFGVKRVRTLGVAGSCVDLLMCAEAGALGYLDSVVLINPLFSAIDAARDAGAANEVLLAYGAESIADLSWRSRAYGVSFSEYLNTTQILIGVLANINMLGMELRLAPIINNEEYNAYVEMLKANDVPVITADDVVLDAAINREVSLNDRVRDVYLPIFDPFKPPATLLAKIEPGVKAVKDSTSQTLSLDTSVKSEAGDVVSGLPKTSDYSLHYVDGKFKLYKTGDTSYLDDVVPGQPVVVVSDPWVGMNS